MKKIIGYFFFSSLTFLLFSSCHKDSILPAAEYQPNYFPLRVGQYTIYDVDSIRFFDVTMTSDTAHYQIMELIDTAFIDNSGSKAFRINRMKRVDESAQWETTDFWTANRTPTTAEKVEENLRFIKIKYPVEDGQSFNGNAYINTTGDLAYLSDWDYRYSDVDVRKYIHVASFDSTITITAQDDQNLIKKDFEQEIYGLGVGLLYKISEHVSKQDVTHSWDQPEKGYIIKMSINKFSK